MDFIIWMLASMCLQHTNRPAATESFPQSLCQLFENIYLYLQLNKAQ